MQGPGDEGPAGLPGARGKKGGAPNGKRNGAYRTGHHTAEAKAELRELRALIRELRSLIDSSEYVRGRDFAPRAF